MRPTPLIPLLLAACAGPGDLTGDEAAPEGPTIVTDGDGFFGAPFPAEGRLGEVSTFPNPDAVPVVDDVLAALAADPDLGFPTTGAIWFPLTGTIDPTLLPDPAGTLLPDSPVRLIALDTGETHPVDLHFEADEQPFAPENLLTLLPVQGIPLRPDTEYAAVLTTSLGLRRWTGGVPDGLDIPNLAAVTTFRTGSPTAGLERGVQAARDLGLPEINDLALLELHDDFCVFQGQVDMPVFQQGDPPYLTGGGGWHPDFELQRRAPSRVFLTIPRRPGPWPVTVMVRTGGGGDRPLIDRGPRAEAGGEAVEPGTGPALHFARSGVAGVMVDGPHGGLRNPGGSDEQFLMFNITNPEALRDNLRQSALELALLPEMLDALSQDFSACADGSLRTDRLALFGHSMGATLAPLVVAVEPRYDLLLLSGAGGSWVENVLHKQLPLEVRPLAEAMLGYDDGALHRHDPFLAMLQWAGESADPPVYAHRYDGDVFMMQGIVDRYILPPIANATSLSLGLDRAGEALDAVTAELAPYRTLGELQPLVGTGTVQAPVSGNAAGRTRVVVQYPEGPIEDGHEVVFQTDAPKAAYTQVLDSWAASGVATVPAP